MANKMDEIIIVAPRSTVFSNEELTFQGVNSDKETTKQIVENISNSFSTMRRGATNDPTPKADNAEINVEFKQPIPYCVIKRGNEVFSYKRLTGGGEARLHNQISLGVGGHLNNVEGLDFLGVLEDGLQRELEEELFINKDKLKLDTVGLINDDGNDVGRVHIGMLVVGELPEDEEVTVRETDQLLGEWIAVEDLKKPEIYDSLETWSQFVVDIL